METTYDNTDCGTVQSQDTDAPTRRRKRGKDGRKLTGYFNNRNALRHGLRAAKLPPGCQFIHVQAKAFRRAIEDAIVRAHGQVSEVHACYVQTALRAEVHATLCAKWLRDAFDRLSPTERLGYSSAIVKASEARDRAIERLNIDPHKASAWDKLDNHVFTVEAQQNAAESNLVAQEGNQDEA